MIAEMRTMATQMQIWVLGYLSGVAMSLNKNALADTSPEDLYRAIDTYCQANPKTNLDMAATAVFASLVQAIGASGTYASLARAAIRPNIVYPDAGAVPGNPSADFQVNLAPDGTIAGVKLLKSSGIPAWDDAAERGLRKTEKLPRDAGGRIYSPLTIRLSPKD